MKDYQFLFQLPEQLGQVGFKANGGCFQSAGDPQGFRRMLVSRGTNWPDQYVESSWQERDLMIDFDQPYDP